MKLYRDMEIELHRDIQIKDNKSSLLNDALHMVQINPTELCNRSCSFCPRSNKKIYPNRDEHISIKTVENLCKGLNKMRFTNRIGFVGFGEPLLHKNIFKCIQVVRDLIPNIQYLEINTNGDKLTYKSIKKLYDSGCSHIAVSMYDKDLTDTLNRLKGDVPIKMIYRHHYSKENNYNLNLVNRDEIIEGANKRYTDNSCNIPFYKAMIDWNGDVLLCENDWARNNKFGNVNKNSFSDIWFSERFMDFRKKLLEGRNTCYPCKGCSVNGLLRGSKSVDIFKEHF
jgi:radical SAM protein with 4Fe4S-binding SPASM domain